MALMFSGVGSAAIASKAAIAVAKKAAVKAAQAEAKAAGLTKSATTTFVRKKVAADASIAKAGIEAGKAYEKRSAVAKYVDPMHNKGLA